MFDCAIYKRATQLGNRCQTIFGGILQRALSSIWVVKSLIDRIAGGTICARIASNRDLRVSQARTRLGTAVVETGFYRAGKMVRDAVCREPVSGVIFPVNREFTGKKWFFGHSRLPFATPQPCNSAVYASISPKNNRELLFSDQEINFSRTGKRSPCNSEQ